MSRRENSASLSGTALVIPRREDEQKKDCTISSRDGALVVEEIGFTSLAEMETELMSGSNSTWLRGNALTSAIGRNQAIAVSLISLVISMWLIGKQVLYANWGMVDDHDIIRLIGAGNHHLPPGQYFHLLFTETELSAIGHYLRFRPFYYMALLGEAVVWGDNVHLWYACRVGLLTTFIAGIWIVVARHLGFFAGLALVLIFMRAPFWSDVGARLGTSETYASAGLGLWVLGLEGMFAPRTDRMRNLSLLAVTFGTFMMVGSKETLFPFAGYSICAFVIFIYLHRESLAAKIHLGLMLSYSAITAYVIALALSRAGQDFLGRSIGLTERIAQLLAPLGGSALQFLLPAALLIGLSAVIIRWFARDGRELRDIWLKPAVSYSIVVFLLWSLYLLQFVAYGGHWPTGYRYDFPGVFAFPALVVASAVFVIAVSRPYPSLNTVLRVCSVVMALAVIAVSLTGRPFPLSTAVAANIDKTMKFQRTLTELAALAKEAPQQPIIFRANGAWTYEKLVSVAIFLRLHYDVSNKIAIKFYPDQNLAPTYVGLGEILKRWELDGGRKLFVPLASIAESAKSGCLSLGFDGPTEPGCRGGFEM